MGCRKRKKKDTGKKKPSMSTTMIGPMNGPPKKNVLK